MREIEKTSIQKFFGVALRSYRKNRHLTQAQMSRQLGITERCYIDLEHSEYCPSSVTLLRFLQLTDAKERDAFLYDVLFQ